MHLPLARRALALAAFAAAAPHALGAQSGQPAAPYDRYLNHADLSQALRALTDRHGTYATLTSLAKTDAGRDVWLLTLGTRTGAPLDTRPALLLVANIEANHTASSSVAMFAAEHMLTRRTQDTAIARLLNERTVYVIPRLNPDGAELSFTTRAYELPYKPHRSNPSLNGLNAREVGADLNGDGIITMMRVRDPEGRFMADPDEPRLMRTADRARAERGLYRLLVEGGHPDSADAPVAMGSDGVNLNRNFPHEFLYFQPHVGPHIASEVETRAIIDFVFDHPNIGAVLSYTAHDNLRTAPPAQRPVPPGVTGNPPNVPTNIMPADRPFFEYISSQFQNITSFRGEGEDGEAGSFAQWAYYQAGLPSFTTPVYAPAPAANAAQRTPHERDKRWLGRFATDTVNGFVNWTAARHPTLGNVEVGGFQPNARVNPPAAQLRGIAEKHAAFAVWLGRQLPKVDIADTRVEARGDNVFLVTATIANEQYLPTQLAMGTRVRFNRPVTIRLAAQPGLTVLSGNTQEQVARIEGMGGRSRHTWLVQATPGTAIRLEVFAERAGGLQAASITLR